MSRHIADQRAVTDGGRVKNFLTLDRTHGGEENHPAVQNLSRRAHSRADENRRMVEFMRIERGRET